VVTELRPSQLDLSSVFNYMFIMVFVVMMFKMVDRALEEPKERLRMLGGTKLPPGYKPVHHSSGGISERKLQELIGEVPDVNDPDRICYWVEADDEMVYLEGWCDKCLIGTGFPTIEAGNHEEKIDYIKDITKETLKRKAKERGLRLIRGGFVETIGPPYYTANLYGVSYGIYQKAEEPHSDGEGNQRGFWLGIAGAERKFPLGQIVMTRGVNDLVAKSAKFSQFVVESFRRHASGDWGDLSPEDKRENELALKAGNLRLFSAYIKPGLPKIWIITEADRSATTILFPEEY
jgi:hypothetical protein